MHTFFKLYKSFSLDFPLVFPMGDYESSAPGRITVYSIQGCPHCTQAKTTLAGLGVPVCDIDLGSHSELRAKVKELTGRSTVPQIFFNNIHVGGNDDLQKLVRKRKTFLTIPLVYWSLMTSKLKRSSNVQKWGRKTNLN